MGTLSSLPDTDPLWKEQFPLLTSPSPVLPDVTGALQVRLVAGRILS